MTAAASRWGQDEDEGARCDLLPVRACELPWLRVACAELCPRYPCVAFAWYAPSSQRQRVRETSRVASRRVARGEGGKRVAHTTGT